MYVFKIAHRHDEVSTLPAFTIDIHPQQIKAVYSDVDLQTAFVEDIALKNDIMVLDCKEGLYERLSVEDNIKFFRKWFHCKIPISELLVMFSLQTCAGTSLMNCSPSEVRRVYYAKYYMMIAKVSVFQEPISNVDLKTMNTFIQLLQQVTKEKRAALLLVSSAEHALLLTDLTYHLREEGLQVLETETEEQKDMNTSETLASPFVENLFKIPAKVDDKVILFDPTEIDYIESQGGKSFIYINKDAFSLDLTLTEIEKKLELYGFYRCHRSYIVNLQKVREIITWSKNTYSLRINNKAQSTIPLSRTKLHTIQEIFKLK